MSPKNHYDLFVSYSRYDKEIVRKIVDMLRSKGYSVWIDTEGINSGEAFSGIITEAIENSDIVLFFSSTASNKSKWTRRELFLSSEEAKCIIPIKLDNSNYHNQIKLLLCDLDYIDLSNPKNREDGIQHLMNSIGNYLGGRSIPMTPGKNDISIVDNNSVRRKLIQNWKSRNYLINLFLISFVFLLFIGLVFSCLHGWIYILPIFFGGIGVLMLILNKEDGVTWIAGSCILWILCNAYTVDNSVVRFFQQSSFISSWLPLIIAALPLCLMFLKNRKGCPWWRKCKKISFIGIIGLLLCGIFWIWLITFDTYTRLGLPANLRYFINGLW